MRNRRVLTIDGPAGSGKSTTARAIAEALGWRFLDTGATYRAMTLALIKRLRERLADEHGREPSEEEIVETVRAMSEEAVDADVQHVELEVHWKDEAGGGIGVILDGEPIPDARLRAEVVSRSIKAVADNPAVRERLVKLQRELAAEKPVVTEGRDQGSVVFPEAAFKFYFYASIEERARRRVNDALARGERAEMHRMQADIARRDEEDRSRRVGRLIQPPGAVVINTTSLSRDEVVAAVLEHVRGIEAEMQLDRDDGEHVSATAGPAAPSDSSRSSGRPGSGATRPSKPSGRFPVAGEEEPS